MNLPGKAEVTKKVADLATELVLTHNTMIVLACFAVQMAEIAKSLRAVSPQYAQFVDEVIGAAVEMSKQPAEPPRVIYTDGTTIVGTKQ